MMNSKSSLTPSITPEIKKQGCAPVHKGWKPFGSGPAPNHRSSSPPTAQDGALPLSFNQPIISKFGNNPVRRAAWGRDRNLLCVQSLLCAFSLGADWSGAAAGEGCSRGLSNLPGLRAPQSFLGESSSQTSPGLSPPLRQHISWL